MWWELAHQETGPTREEGVQAHGPLCRTPALGPEPRNEHLSCVAANRKGKGLMEKTAGTAVTWQGLGGCRAGAGASGRPCPLQLSWEMQPASWGTIAATSPNTPGLAGGGPVVSCPCPHADHSPGPPERQSSPPILAHSFLVDTTYHLLTLGLSQPHMPQPDTHQLHADDKGWLCGSEVQDRDPGLGPFLRGEKSHRLLHLAPQSPTSALLTARCPQTGTRATARPRAGPGLQHLHPATYGCHRTNLRWAADRPKPARSTFQQGQGQVGAGTGALWGPGDPRSLRAASARPGSCLGPDGLSQGGRFWAVSTPKAQDGTPECSVGGCCA